MTPDALKLINACCEAIDKSAFRPRNGSTYCNQAVQFVGEKIGCAEFRGMLANQMVHHMETSDNFKEVPMGAAQNLTNQGFLLIAGEKAEPHGHVCILRPGLEDVSGKWGVKVPMVLNIGKTNTIGSALNWAFSTPPKIWMWQGVSH